MSMTDRKEREVYGIKPSSMNQQSIEIHCILVFVLLPTIICLNVQGWCSDVFYIGENRVKMVVDHINCKIWALSYIRKENTQFSFFQTVVYKSIDQNQKPEHPQPPFRESTLQETVNVVNFVPEPL